MDCTHEAVVASPAIICEELFRKRIALEANRPDEDRTPVTAILGLRVCQSCGQTLILAGVTSRTDWRVTAKDTLGALGITHGFAAFVIVGSEPDHVVAGWTDGAHEQAMAFHIGGDDPVGREEMEDLFPAAWPSDASWALSHPNVGERISSILNDFADLNGWEVIISGSLDGEPGLYIRHERQWVRRPPDDPHPGTG